VVDSPFTVSADPDASQPDATAASARPGPLVLGDGPDGLPDPNVQPPTLAESADPFASLRVIDLMARLQRARPARIAEIVDRLNAAYPDWLFEQRVVIDVIVALQANWMADYRNSSGIVLEDGPFGATVAVEDSSRVDPWIVRQAQRIAGECQARLAEFARTDRVTGDG
jgi:hypothetical protein